MTDLGKPPSPPGVAIGRAVRRSLGFTLIEVVVAIVLLGMLAAIGANMVGDTMNTAFITTHNHSSGSQARYAEERLTREIREMAYGTFGYDITAKTATVLTFNKEDGTAVTITSSGGVLTLRYTPGTVATLTDQVSAFAFAYLDQFGATTASNEDVRFVQVTMTVTNAKTGQSDSLRTRIFLRNAQMSPV